MHQLTSTVRHMDQNVQLKYFQSFMEKLEKEQCMKRSKKMGPQQTKEEDEIIEPSNIDRRKEEEKLFKEYEKAKIKQ